MRSIPLNVRFLQLCLGMALVATSALAQSNVLDSQAAHVAAPQDRVQSLVTEEQRTILRGQTRRMDPAAIDLGEVSSSLATGRMVLWLRRSAEQQAHLGQFLSKVQDSKSASFRHWMTPASYGAAYGISDHDLAAVEQWLQANGLKVEKVSAGRNAILFSGTVGDVANAFHTGIHSYAVGQALHVANVSDPEIPTALAPVIAGLSPMNDFRAKPLHVLGAGARYDAGSHRIEPVQTEATKAQPALTGGSASSGYSLYVTPADASMIYDTPNKNFNPAATQTLDGTGVTIGILGYSALAMADVQNYRTAFLPAGASSNLPTQILDGGTDPGVIDGDVAEEGLLDAEVSGGLAPGAAINYYYAASTDLSDGLILAGLRALEDNKVNILSVSYGECEADLGFGGNLEWSELWQQAAAQGISVTVSTGDSGSASCDTGSSSKEAASLGLSVSGLSSTPYNIAVGGTDYYSLADNFGTYVNTANAGSYPYYASALGYIPENPWNNSSSVVGSSFTQNQPAYNGVSETNIVAGGGGLSSQASCQGYQESDGSCSQALSGYPQPAYQTGFQQETPVRSVPDVSLLSANGFYGASWIFCSDSTVDAQGGVYTDCQTDANGQLLSDTPIGLIGGTSAAAPAFAGMLAMISQSQGGARLGQADTVLYNLAQDYNPSPSSPGKYQRAFHDVAIGNNSVYCASGTLNCGTNNFLEGYNATPSYDMATGLGSIDLSQLIDLWTSTNFISTTNTLTAGTTASGSMSAAPISVVHGTSLSFTTAVTPGDATGQFSIVTTNSSNAASYLDYGTLDGTGTGNLTTNDLPGGSYTVYAYYAGDTTHTGSQSSNGISVSIGQESSTTSLSFGTYDPVTNADSEGISSVAYGEGTYINAQPFGNNSTVQYTGTLQPDGIATGSVTFTSNAGTTQTAAINSVGIAQLSINSLAPGTYTYKASYPGDASFAPSTSTAQTLTITKGTTSFLLQSSATAVTPVDTVTLTAILQTDSIALYPTGTVAASANGHTYPPTSSSAGSNNGAVANEFYFTVPASDLAAGSNVIGVSYGGDSNYQSASNSVSVTLAGETGSFTLAGPSQPLVVEASQTGSTTISITPANGFTGAVSFTCTVSAAPSGHTPTCGAVAATVYGSFGATSAVTVATYADTPAGNYTITVTGAGGGQSQSVTIPMQVTTGPGIALTAADSSISLASVGQSASDTLSIAPLQGFTGTVALNCVISPVPSSGKAPGCTLPGSVTLGAATQTATLQIGSDATTAPGSYTAAITATSGSVQATLALPLTVQGAAASAGFGLSAASGTISIASAGQSATDTLTIRPSGGFTGTVQLSCAVTGGSASAPGCTVPTTASVTGAEVVNAMLTVNTASPSTALAANESRKLGERAGGIVLGCLLLFFVPKRRVWGRLGLLLLTAGALAITACGGNGHSGTGTGGSSGTPAGSYTVTVTAMSGSITATTQVSLTVQ